MDVNDIVQILLRLPSFNVILSDRIGWIYDIIEFGSYDKMISIVHTNKIPPNYEQILSMMKSSKLLINKNIQTEIYRLLVNNMKIGNIILDDTYALQYELLHSQIDIVYDKFNGEFYIDSYYNEDPDLFVPVANKIVKAFNKYAIEPDYGWMINNIILKYVFSNLMYDNVIQFVQDGNMFTYSVFTLIDTESIRSFFRFIEETNNKWKPINGDDPVLNGIINEETNLFYNPLGIYEVYYHKHDENGNILCLRECDINYLKGVFNRGDFVIIGDNFITLRKYGFGKRDLERTIISEINGNITFVKIENKTISEFLNILSLLNHIKLV